MKTFMNNETILKEINLKPTGMCALCSFFINLKLFSTKYGEEGRLLKKILIEKDSHAIQRTVGRQSGGKGSPICGSLSVCMSLTE